MRSHHAYKEVLIGAEGLDHDMAFEESAASSALYSTDKGNCHRIEELEDSHNGCFRAGTRTIP